MGTHGKRGSRTTVANALALLVAVTVLALVACGGSSTPTPGPTPEPTPTPSEAAITPSPSWSPTMSPAPIPVVKPGDKLPPFARLAAMYAYDTSEPFGTSLGVAYPKGAATVTPIAFNANGSQASGYLVMPQGEGPFPVVLWAPAHGIYEGAAMWLPDALKLAKAGYAGFLLEEPSTLADNFDAFDEGKGIIDYVVQASRALDLLATMPEIDAERIGFVGWSMGTLPGAYLSGLDDRIKAFVIAATSSSDPTPWAAADKAAIRAQGMSVKAYAAQTSIFDPGLYFRRNKTAPFLFMWGQGELDPYAKAWYLANAPRHATLRVHNAPGHALLADANKMLIDWIQKNL